MEDNTLVAQLTRNTVILNLTLGKPGNNRKVNNEDLEVAPADEPAEGEAELNPARLRHQKKLFESPTLQRLAHLHGEVRRWVAARGLPTRFVKNGFVIIRSANIPAVNAYLEVKQAEHEALVAQFGREYPSLVTESYANLGPLANARDYPSVERILGEFEFFWQYLTLDVPRKVLGSISSALVAQEEEKIRGQLVQMASDVEAHLSGLFQKIVEQFLACLVPDEHGKKKKVNERFLNSLNKFFDTFADKDLGTNGTLTGLVEQARSLVNGFDPATIETDVNAQAFLQTRLTEINEAIRAAIRPHGGRAVMLTDVAPTQPAQEEHDAAGPQQV